MQRFIFNISQKVRKLFFLNSKISSEILTKKPTENHSRNQQLEICILTLLMVHICARSLSFPDPSTSLLVRR